MMWNYLKQVNPAKFLRWSFVQSQSYGTSGALRSAFKVSGKARLLQVPAYAPVLRRNISDDKVDSSEPSTNAEKVSVDKVDSSEPSTNAEKVSVDKVDSSEPSSNAEGNGDSTTEGLERDLPKEYVHVTFVTGKGEVHRVKGEVGQSLMVVASGLNIVEGACGGICICTTCHMYVSDELAPLASRMTEVEADLLDTVLGYTPESRLGCQIFLTKELDGATFQLPEFTTNFFVGKKPETD